MPYLVSKASPVLSLPILHFPPLGCPEPALFPLPLTPMGPSRSYVLLQKGEDPFHTRFEDLDGLTAFTM